METGTKAGTNRASASTRPVQVLNCQGHHLKQTTKSPKDLIDLDLFGKSQEKTDSAPLLFLLIYGNYNTEPIAFLLIK